MTTTLKSINMRKFVFIIFASLITWTTANDDVQYIKSVKGGHGGGGFQYNAGSNLARFYGNNTQQGFQGYGMRTNLTAVVDYEIGVCYIEVPTASLAKDPAHIPVGNGSRPDLSRIRSCCNGYIRNIHNYKICDPVCTHECVNALCTAPEVCTCFPDHVKNLAGFCVATCPIGCQNGQCSGGECICKDGYKLDSESKFCMPSCRENCGGIGNCTSPNKCECRSGFEATPEGNCKPVCSQCTNGDCVAPNECRCRPGYTKDQRGQCVPHCPQGCGPNGRCVSPNVCNFPSTSTTTNPPGGHFVTNHPLPTNQHVYPFSNPPQTTNQPANFNPNQPASNQPGYYNPNQQSPNQPLPNQPGYFNPNQPGYPYPNQPSPNQPGYPNSNQPVPNQPGNPYPNQPAPNQPGYSNPNQQPANQPGYFNANQPLPPNQQQPSNDSSHQPTFYQQPNQPSNYPLYPGNQVVPQCSQICVNGVCVEGNRCSCNPGYVLDRNDPTGTICIPSCPGGCPNGICSAPNFCICNMGYYKDHSVKGRPACVKRAKRSVDSEPTDNEIKNPINVAELLIFDIPEEY